MSSRKQRLRHHYETQPTPDAIEGGIREFNGYRMARTYQLLLDGLQKATHDWRDLYVLDAGCGSGDTGSFLAEHNRVVGLDFSQQMARFAQSHYARVGVGDVERLPFADASFDGVMASGVWQCLVADTPFLSEVARVLRPGGRAVFGWMLNREFLLYRRGVHLRADPSVQLTALSASEILRYLADAGLQVEQLYPVVFPLGVFRMRPPFWMRPLVAGFTVLCSTSLL
jgi:SAM-dependent methyltransferase